MPTVLIEPEITHEPGNKILMGFGHSLYIQSNLAIMDRPVQMNPNVCANNCMCRVYLCS